MNIKKLILEAYDQGVRLTLKDESLVAISTGEKMAAPLRAQIKEHKEDIIAYLKDQARHEVVLNKAFDSIPTAPVQDSYPIPTSLFRIWVLSQFRQGNVAYNMPGAIDFEGHFSIDVFDKAFQYLIARHEILRTVFREDETGEVRQYVRTPEEIAFTIGFRDLSTEPDNEEKLKAVIADLVVQPFDLATGPLLRADIFRLSDDRHVFFFNMHHIINDGWSMEVFINEIFHLYNALKEERPINLSPLRIQYKDYALWQLSQLKGKEQEAHRLYWLNQFSGEIPVLELPGDFNRPSVQTYNGSILRTSWSTSQTNSFHSFVKSQDGTPFMGLLAVVYVLLHRYTSQDDIIIGSPTAGRTHEDLESQLGFYVNTLALRAKFSSSDTFAELFRKVKKTTLEAFDHQVYPFGDLVDELNLSRDISRSPLFDVMLVLHNNEVRNEQETTLTGLKVHHYNTDYVTSKFDLSFYFKEVDGAMKVSIEYNVDIFSAPQIEAMLAHFERLVMSMIARPDIPINKVDFLSAEEKQRELSHVSEVPVATNTSATLSELFIEQVKLHPLQTALRASVLCVSYEELNKASDKIAGFLTSRFRLKKEELIGVMLPLGKEYVTAILGILKAGGAYVPIEVTYPFQRVKNIVEDANIRLLIVQNESNEVADHLQWECSTQPAYLTIDNDNRFNEVKGTADKESKDLWDYVAEEAGDDIIKGGGWFNSYTSDPFSADEMEEFSENVKKKLGLYLDKSKRALEVGCGSGLIMRKIAPHVSSYTATDISPVLIDRISRRAAEMGLDNVVCRCVSASQLDEAELGTFDIIILNSVVQYFPGHGYLRKVIEQCLNVLSDSGILFLGDIMELGSRQALIDEHTQFKKEHPDAQTKLDFSTELFLSRTFFRNLALRDDVAAVTTSDKYGTIKNELSRYRYDALITKGKRNTLVESHTQRFYKSDIEEQPEEFAGTEISPDQLAYVTYTSGSTGRPKGVMISHKNVVSFLANYKPVFHMTRGMTVGALTNISFDISVLEVIGSLCMGMEVVFLPGNDPAKLAEEIRLNPVDVLQLTPSRLQQLMFCSNTLQADMRAVKVLLVGGEALQQVQYEWLKLLPDTYVLNVYGPTETTVWSSALYLRGSNALSVGKALAGERLLVLDDARQLVPRGVAGEIFIGGSGLSCGYLNQQVLTDERFINDPYNKQQKIYATGDRGRWQADGNLVFCGRKDKQVKVRGYRIELGEIENTLVQSLLVGAAIVLITQNEHAENEITAFVIPRDHMQEDDLHAYLADRLPAYMIPSRFIMLEAFPLLPSGKVDRKLLAEMVLETSATNKFIIGPRNIIEKKLQTFWSDVLGRKAEQISVDDNFFHLGGHSLKATRLMSMINKEFNVGLLLNDLFVKATIAEQGELIVSSKEKLFERIPVLPVQESYELSSPQLRLWVLSKFEGGSIAYNMPGVFSIRGRLRTGLLQEAFRQIIRRHEILRTVFRDNYGNVRQVILPDSQLDFHIAFRDLTDAKNAIAFMEADIDRKKIEPFDLKHGPLFQACLYQLQAHEFVFFFSMHHIISDGWSMEIFMREMIIIYNGLLVGKDVTLVHLPIQYKDYAAWQQRQLQGESLEAHRKYWTNQFAGELPVLDFPEDFVRPALMTHRGSEVNGRLDAATTTALRSVVRETGGTLFMGLLAGVNAILHRYTGAEDIIIGSPVAGREHIDLENQIGFYINTLALRTKFSGTDSFSQLVQAVKDVTLGAYDHQIYPFEQLIDDLKISRDTSRSPLFNIMVILQNNETLSREMAFDNFTISTYESRSLTSKFDITFIFTEVGTEIEFIIEYCSDVYSASQMELFAHHFTALMSVLAKDARLSIDAVQYLSKEEISRIIEAPNDTRWAYDEDQTIISLFEKQIALQPEKTALAFEDICWSYKQLNEAANQLSIFLNTRYAVAPDDLIAIQLRRSPWMVASMLAVLKSGAAYVPIDPDFPEERISYILSDSECKVCIDDTMLGQFLAMQDKLPVTNRDVKPLPRHLAYVIYTSGSTGRPKGVMIEHRSVVSFIENMEHVFHLTSGNVIGATTNFTFDISVLELLGTLAIGATCYLIDASGPEEILSLISSGKIDALQTTPSRLKQLFAADKDILRTLERLRVLLVGGEALGTTLYDALKKLHSTRVINVYGPTETTIWSSCQVLTESSGLSIGRPLLNERMYILDKNLNPVPERVSGEISIGGNGLARGYRNNSAMTSAKFISDPYTGGNMYRTGDIGYRTVDGAIVFVGRADDQVKVRGYRIELGEIEKVLSGYEGVHTCFVTTITDGENSNELAAYLVVETKINPKDVKAYLETKLPNYMVPSYVVQLDSLPLTPSGKVNKKALPVPKKGAVAEGMQHTTPINKTQKTLVGIWSEILDIPEDMIDVNSNFFDLGGNSINAIRLIAQVNNLFDLNLPLISVFQHGTVVHLAEVIESAVRPATQGGIVPMQPNGDAYPLFLVAGTGGFVAGFYPLVQALDGLCPVYGLEPKGIMGDEPPLSTVEELAAYYVAAIRGVQANGPYRLLGHSFGAYVVFEMAVQLNALGEEVSHLFLFDTGVPEYDGRQSSIMTQEELKLGLLHAMQQYFDWSLPVDDSAYLQLSEAAQHQLLQQWLMNEGIQLSVDQVRGYSNVFVAQGSTRYYPRHCLNDTEVVLFKTVEMDEYVIKKGSESLGWESFSQMKPAVYDVPGSHISMLKKGNIEIVSKYLSEYLTSAFAKKYSLNT